MKALIEIIEVFAAQAQRERSYATSTDDRAIIQAALHRAAQAEGITTQAQIALKELGDSKRAA